MLISTLKPNSKLPGNQTLMNITSGITANNEKPTDEALQARVDAALGLGSSGERSKQPVQHKPGENPIGVAADADFTKLGMLMDVNLQLSVELGRTRMTVRQVLDLQNGSVVELDRLAGEAVDIYVNDHILARGEVVVVDDKFGVRISELISPQPKSGEV